AARWRSRSAPRRSRGSSPTARGTWSRATSPARPFRRRITRHMPPDGRDVRLLHDQRVPTRDGITLSADVYLPLSGGPRPTIVQWTPYESTRERSIAWGVWFARRGYAAVVVDCRGRYESGGDFVAWELDGVDAHDTLTWAAEQQWCNGRIGTWGRSYGG